MRKLYVLIGMFLLMGCVTIDDRQDNTVKVVLKSRCRGKGFYATCKIVLKNTSEKAKWFLILRPNAKLKSFRFQSNKRGQKLFRIKKYTNKKNKTVVLTHYGYKRDVFFEAVRLPANTTVCFEKYDISLPDPIKTLEVIETENLNLNGKQRLVEWLPIDCASDSVTISDGTSSSGERLGDKDGYDDITCSICPNNLIKFITISQRNFKKYDFNFKPDPSDAVYLRREKEVREERKRAILVFEKSIENGKKITRFIFDYSEKKMTFVVFDTSEKYLGEIKDIESIIKTMKAENDTIVIDPYFHARSLIADDYTLYKKLDKELEKYADGRKFIICDPFLYLGSMGNRPYGCLDIPDEGKIKKNR